MSPKSPTLPPGKGRRNISGKPGRFDPSEPLHMTTRKAARNGRPNGTPSINGSAEDDESGRGSLDDVRPTTSQSLGSQTGRRISGSSTNGASVVNMSFETQSSLDKKFDEPGRQPESPIRSLASPSRKRKRSSPMPPETPNGVGEISTPPTNNLSYLDTEDAVEVIPFEALNDREPDSSSESEDPFVDNYLGVAQSTELTPAATPAGSEAVSPISEMSNSGVAFPNKDLDISMVDADQQVEPDDQEEVDDAEDLPGVDEVDDMEDVDDQDEQDRADGKRPPKLAGRRRADHPQADIEATMRRQLQLKSAYRSIARALKPVLAEISLKTVEELESNPVAHEQVVEYQGTEDEPGIQAILDQIFARRKAQLEAQRKWSTLQLQKTRDGETEVRRSRCLLQVENLRQTQLDYLEHDVLVVAREAQINDGDAGYETEDEDGDVIPRPHHTGYRFARGDALDSKYKSRSREAMETERAIHDLQRRFDMHKMLQEAYGKDNTIPRPGFTVMDDAPRRVADGKRESIRNTSILADAAAEAERLATIRTIPNEEALGLQMLGDLASRPSIRATAPPPRLTPKREDPFGPLLHQAMPPPPPFRAPFPPENAPQRMYPLETAHQERIHLPGPPAPMPQESMPEPQQWEHPFLSPKATTNHNGVFSPGRAFGSKQSPHRQTVSQIPPPGPGLFGQSPVRHQDHDRAQSCAPTPTRNESHREHYQRPLTMERETRQSPDRVLHDFSSGPLSIERVKPAEEQTESRPTTQHQNDPAGEASPSRPSLQAGPHWEPPSSPGAADSRSMLDPLLRYPPPESTQEGVVIDPRSRASSIISQSTGTEASPDETGLGESGRRGSKQKGQKNSSFGAKASKTDRHGLTRRMYKGSKRQSQSGAREKGPSVLRFRLNSEVGTTPQQSQPPPPWPPSTGPHPPPPDYYGPHPQFPGYWAPHMHPHGGYGYPHPPEYGHAWPHRDSIPPPGTPHGWAPAPHPPQSPLYAIPPGAPPPPDQWPPPPHYAHPPPGPHTPVQLQPPLAAAPAYGPKASGQPLAPNTDPRSYSGGGAGPPNHPPAFAQQQRQSEGVRRRAQSDTQHTKFKQYQPRPT